MPVYDVDYEARAMLEARFDEDACCLQCGDCCERFQMPNGICPACSSLDREEGEAE